MVTWLHFKKFYLTVFYMFLTGFYKVDFSIHGNKVAISANIGVFSKTEASCGV